MPRTQPFPQPTAPPNVERAAPLQPRDLTTASISGWSYLGCFSDSNDRVLTAANHTAANRNHPGFCCDFCTHLNTDYSLCGVESANQCFCDSATQVSLRSLSASECSDECPGQGDVACGGIWAIDLYSLTDSKAEVTTAATITVAEVPGYSYLGCYTDDMPRVLDGNNLTTPMRMDPAFCCSYCAQAGLAYHLCGVEDGNQCYCANSTSARALLAAPTDCSDTCAGAGSLRCGGVWRINIYSATGLATSSSSYTTSSYTTSTPASTPTSPDPRPSRLSGGAIAGIVIGVVAALLLLLWLAYRFTSLFSKPSADARKGVSNADASTVGHNNPAQYQGPLYGSHGRLSELPSRGNELAELESVTNKGLH